jgi:ABC-type sulfate transport system substrate-binding protein
LIGKHYYRPTEAKAVAKYASKFPKLQLLTIADFGGWKQAQKKHFADGGVFDQIYK